MQQDHWDLLQATSHYGDSMLKFGLKGGYRMEGNAKFSVLVPQDKEAHKNACHAYGKVIDLLDYHFKKSIWRLMWERFWGLFGG